jgi:hypothetical protein
VTEAIKENSGLVPFAEPAKKMAALDHAFRSWDFAILPAGSTGIDGATVIWLPENAKAPRWKEPVPEYR